MATPAENPLPSPICSLLLFVATPAEEEALREQADRLQLDFRKDPALTKYFRDLGLRDEAWTLGTIGAETVVAAGYFNDYSAVEVERARSALVERCLREKERTKFDFAVHVGAMLSGAARIHCAKFRDELYRTAPHGNEPIVGGEMEGVGLLAAAVKADDPAWCVVKGISDFADEQRDEDIRTGLTVAPRNAAYFVLSSLVNDARMLAEREEP
jgi:hypothetical protein